MADTREHKDNSIPLSGKKLGYTFNNRNFHNVSLGQGQEVVAEAALDLAAKKGHWVILQVSPLYPDRGHSGPCTCLDLTGHSLGSSLLSTPLPCLSFHTLALSHCLIFSPSVLWGPPHPSP